MFKRSLEVTYSLKLKHSRAFFNVVGQKYPTTPFSIASIEDATTARVGVTECLNHDMLQPYPVLAEKTGEFVAQFKTTAVLLPSGTLVLSEIPFEDTMYDSTCKIEDKAVLDLLASSLDRKQIKKAKKAAAPKTEAKKPEDQKTEVKKEEAKSE